MTNLVKVLQTMFYLSPLNFLLHSVSVRTPEKKQMAHSSVRKFSRKAICSGVSQAMGKQDGKMSWGQQQRKSHYSLKPKRKRKLPRLVAIREGFLTSAVFLGRETLAAGSSWPGRKRPGRINIPNSLCSHWLKSIIS